MVFLIRTFYENIGIPKSQISGSFVVFLQEYIKNMIDYCQNNNLKLVVVTHHCPTYEVLKYNNSRKNNDKFISLYVTDLDYLLQSSKIHTWICGHIHKNFDFITKGGTRIVGNQKGKPRDNISDFSKNCLVKIN